MELLKEKQLTLRASRRPVEYNYTNADIHHQDTTPHDGYQFEYPVNWAGDPSTNKVIGIRRINYKPTSIDLAVRFAVENPHDEDNPYICDVAEVFTDQNSFEECIARISSVINDTLVVKNAPCRCITTYNKDTGVFALRFEDGEDFLRFLVIFPIGNDSAYDGTDESFNKPDRVHFKKNLAYLFNQEFNKELCDEFHSWRNSNFTQITFNNVWNRDNFYCHATFSDSPKQIIGVNKDFWPTPSVFYANSTNSNDFNIYFTTDTVHRILPRNGVLLIQLSYIFNFANSMLTYV